jgi:Xaa-Pro aminopeptidase
VSRLAACIDLMARDDIDVLVLGREANARTVTAVSRLWLAGTRPFSPGCVVVRQSEAVHVLANTDAVVATDFPVERLYGITWNPEKLLVALTAIDGVADARRVAVDGMTPMASGLLARAMPEAEVVDAGPLFAELWSVPDPEKIAGVEHAAEVAGLGLGAMAAMLQPGRTPRDLRGTSAVAFAHEGVTTPAFEAVAAPLGAQSSTWLPSERSFVDGEQVVLRAGALRDGWEASLARTYLVGSPSAEQPPPTGWDALVAECAPGTAAGALRARGAVVHGVGRGVEPWPDDLVLVPGLMAAIELRGDASLRQDVVRITESDPHVVTTPSRVVLRISTG